MNNTNEQEDEILNDNISDTDEDDTVYENDTLAEDIAYDDESGAKDKLKKLRDDLKSCQKEKTENLNGWQRSQADYANLKREAAEIRLQTTERAKAGFVEDLLPALDSFSMAFSNKEAWEKVDQNWRIGVEYIYNQLMSVLADNGVSPIDQIDVEFDPSLHESIETIPAEKPELDHTIAQIIQKGYRIGTRVIRPARVIVRVFKA